MKTGDKDFSAAVQIISGADADAVFYAGYYAEAAPFVQGLRDGGVDIPFVSADGTNDPQFVSQAGPRRRARSSPARAARPRRTSRPPTRRRTARRRACTRSRATTSRRSCSRASPRA
nr:hypothetical protein [Cellulosimicrobium sp. MM]